MNLYCDYEFRTVAVLFYELIQSFRSTPTSIAPCCKYNRQRKITPRLSLQLQKWEKKKKKRWAPRYCETKCKPNTAVRWYESSILFGCFLSRLSSFESRVSWSLPGLNWDDTVFWLPWDARELTFELFLSNTFRIDKPNHRIKFEFVLRCFYKSLFPPHAYSWLLFTWYCFVMKKQ